MPNNHIGHIFIPGFPRCGTTSLYNYLTQHSQIISNKKEYRALHSSITKKRYDEMIGANRDPGFPFYTIDATPAYSWRQNWHSETYAKQFYPDSKVIMLLRNPVDQFYSVYWFGQNRDRVKKKPKSTVQKNALKLEFQQRWRELIEEHASGKYVEGISRWKLAFPNLRIFIYEELFFNNKIVPHVNSLFEELKLMALPSIDLTPQIPGARSMKDYPLLDENVRDEILNYTRPIITQIENLIGLKTGWLD